MNDIPPEHEPIAQDQPFTIEVAERVRRLPPYLFAEINKLMYEKRRAGADVIDLGMGNPSDPPQDLVIEKLAEAARDPKNHGYSPAQGILSLRREAAAKYFKQYGVRLDPQREVIACLGSKEGFSHMCLALVGPGDTAIVPAPYYPAHLYAVAMAAANAILLEVFDSERLLTNIDYTCRHLMPRPKLLVVNFPHNPSTTVVEPEFYVEIVKLAKRYGFMVISDLAYADVTFDGYKTPSFLAAPGRHRRGRRADDDEQRLQHGRLAGGFCRGQRRNAPRPVDDQGLLRLRHVPAHPDRRHHGLAAYRRGGRGPGGHLSAPPRRALRRAGTHRLAGRTAQGQHVRVGQDARALGVANELHGLRHEAAAGRRRGGEPRRRLRPGRRRISSAWRWWRTKTVCVRPCGRSAGAWGNSGVGIGRSSAPQNLVPSGLDVSNAGASPRGPRRARSAPTA